MRRFLFLLLSFVACGMLNAQETNDSVTISYGYCNNELVSGIGYGEDNPATFGAAIRIQGLYTFEYFGAMCTGIDFELAYDVDSVQIFVSKKANLLKDEIEWDSVGNLTAGWHHFDFDTPVKLVGNLYVGYKGYGAYPIGMSSATPMYQSKQFYLMQDTSEWVDATQEFGMMPLIRAVLKSDKIKANVKTHSLSVPTLVNGEDNVAQLKIQNQTFGSLTKLNLDCVVDSDTTNIDVDCNIDQYDIKVVEVPIQYPGTTGSHNLTVIVKQANGEDDGYADDNTQTATLLALSQRFTPKVVMEEATGNWCGWCPLGMYTIETLKEKYPDTFIPICVHFNENGTGMEANGYSELLELFDYTAPQAIWNRKSYTQMTPYVEYADALYEYAADGCLGKIELKAEYSPDLDSVYLSASTTLGLSYNNYDADYKVSFVVLEDSVGPFNQVNYYSGREPKAGQNAGEWNNAADTVSTLYNDVARAIYDYDGLSETRYWYGTNMQADTTYTFKYQLELPDNINKIENVSFVALLFNAAGTIVNADKVKPYIDPTVTSVRDVNVEKVNVRTVDGKLMVDGNYDSVAVYTMNGQQVNSSQLAPGLYIVKVMTKGKTVSKKIMVK
ncbi:MAG: T9SS type A sorting domain-containing protein [Prevotella sp.]|jgi:hypothetical protein